MSSDSRQAKEPDKEMNATATFKPRDQVVHTELEVGNAVLLDLKTHRYFSLNESGAFIWTAISEGSSTDDIAEKLAAHFSIDTSKALHDVNSLLKQLRDAELIVEA